MCLSPTTQPGNKRLQIIFVKHFFYFRLSCALLLQTDSDVTEVFQIENTTEVDIFTFSKFISLHRDTRTLEARSYQQKSVMSCNMHCATPLKGHTMDEVFQKRFLCQLTLKDRQQAIVSLLVCGEETERVSKNEKDQECFFVNLLAKYFVKW